MKSHYYFILDLNYDNDIFKASAIYEILSQKSIINYFI